MCRASQFTAEGQSKQRKRREKPEKKKRTFAPLLSSALPLFVLSLGGELTFKGMGAAAHSKCWTLIDNIFKHYVRPFSIE